MQAETMMLRDRALHADLLESLRRGTAEVLWDAPHAVLLRERTTQLLLFAADDYEAGTRVLSTVSPEDWIVVRGDGMMEFARDRLQMQRTVPCWQVLYEKAEPLPLRGTLTIRHPDEADYEKVRATYRNASDAELRADFARADFLGAYANGSFAGYIGTHSEGAMGLLEIFPEYRRRGYAQEIYSALINRQLRLGRLPYAQIVEDNAASMALQRKLGFTVSKKLIFWMWR